MINKLGTWVVTLALLAALPQAVATGAEPPAGPTAKDLVELPAGRVYELLAQHDRETVWIPIERPGRDGVEDLLLSSQPHDVAVGTRHDLSLVEAFSATLRASPGKPAAATSGTTGEDAAHAPSSPNTLTTAPGSAGIALAVQLSKLPAPATYDVHLRLQARDSRDFQLLKLQITVPPAVLRARTALVIDRVLPLLGGLPDVVAPPLVLTETGQKSRAQVRDAVTLITEAGEVQAVAGRIQIELPREVPSGGLAALPVSTVGDFPLGTVKGTLDVQSPQLTAPASLSFEVRTRRSKWLIAVVLLLGLLAGWLTRTMLAARIALQEQFVKLEALAERIVQAWRSTEDAGFRDKLSDLRKSLDAARNSGEPTAIATAVADCETKLTAALTELREARKALAQRVRDLQAQLGPGLSAPPTILQTVSSTRRDLDDLLTAIDAGDLATVEGRFSDISQRGVQAIAVELRRWQGQIELDLARLQQSPPPLSDADSEALAAAVAKVHTALSAIDPDQRDPNLGRILTALHSANLALDRLVLRLPQQLAQGIRDLLPLLQSLQLNTDAIQAAAAPLGTPPSAPAEANLAWLRTQIDGLVTALDGLLSPLLLLPHVTDAARSDLKPLLDKHRYPEVARRLQALGQDAARRVGGPMGGDLPVRGPSLTGPAPMATEPGRPENSGAFAVPSGSAGVPQKTIALGGTQENPALATPSSADAQRSLGYLKLLQMSVASLGLTAAGFLLFEGKFIGTVQELVTLFFWGFASDISVDALLSASGRGQHRPEPPTNVLPPPAGGTP